MRSVTSLLLATVVSIFPVLARASDCPKRPEPGSNVVDPYAIVSQNGVLQASMTLARSVDTFGYTHYCYKYQLPHGIAEAPTLRVNPGDELQLHLTNEIKPGDMGNSFRMEMTHPQAQCGDGGAMTISSTNVHFHGMNVPPICHQDDVIDTLIQPGTSGFDYKVEIPSDQPPGLYWYHPHVHGFTEFQVNGGAAGAIIVEGMDKVRPEVAGLKERVLIIRQQYLVPWIPGPYQLTLNYQVDDFPKAALPVIKMKPGEKQFWRVANATLQDFIPLQVWIDGNPEPLELVAMDGYPLPQTRNIDTVFIPPAGRAEFIVQAPPTGSSGQVYIDSYDTGPTGNPDLATTLARIDITQKQGADGVGQEELIKHEPSSGNGRPSRFKVADLRSLKPTAHRKLYFSEQFGGTNGPIQFYITVDGQKQKVFDPNEKPVITTKVGAVEDWTIENRALETHAFHMHQIHFMLLEVDGKPVDNPVMLDTVAIPYWDGHSPYHSVKVRMDFSDPTTAGTFLFHCHVLLHEDLGMMHKILVEP